MHFFFQKKLEIVHYKISTNVTRQNLHFYRESPIIYNVNNTKSFG